METAKVQLEEIPCPRCGYDQRGFTATWVEQCPLDGRCAECGLDYRWSEVLMPQKFEPRWCVEFARGWRFQRTCATTFLQSFRPWVFWTRLKMSHAIRWRRICGYVLCLLLFLLLTYVLAQAGVAVFVRHSMQQWLASQAAAIPRRIAQVQASLNPQNSNVSDQDRRQYASLHQNLLARQAALGTNPTVGISYVDAVCEAIFTPLAQSSSGQPTVPLGAGAGGYVPPAELWNMAAALIGAPGMAPTGSFDRIESRLLWLKVNWALFLLLPVSLVLLPISMRRAKVQWRHICRVALYSLFIPVTVLLAGAILMILSLRLSVLRGTLQSGVDLLCRHSWIMVVVWWAAALHWYMRIPHAAATILLLMLLCSLFVLAAIWFIDPRLAMEMSEFMDPWRW